MTPLGTIVAVIEAIPRELLKDPSASAPDFRLVADKLAHAEKQVRCLAETQQGLQNVVERLLSVNGTKARTRA